VSDDARRVGSVEDLLSYFRDAEKPRAMWLIGTEHEKIGVFTDTHQRMPYEGERGIGALLSRIAQIDGWDPIIDEGRLIGLRKDGASITLEPGGQLELSGAPLRSVRETCGEFRTHVELLKKVSEGFGVAWLALGADPLHDLANIPEMPKSRYHIMRAYLPQKGPLAMDMMHATATVQANFDYSSEEDMTAKMRVAMGCSPIVSSIFANSSLREGRESGYMSHRVEIWRHTDPDRCGILPFVFEPGFGYLDYAEWALDVPMFFVVRDHHYLPADGTTFREFMTEGYAEQKATVADWDLHLTTLCPEVRRKRFSEVRGADAVSPDMICALPALWKGLLYDADAGRAAWELVSGWTLEERNAALVSVAREGLQAAVRGRPVLDLARELVDISADGLRRIASEGPDEPDERSFLDPLRAQIELGKSPARVILELWRGEWAGSVERLIEYARY